MMDLRDLIRKREFDKTLDQDLIKHLKEPQHKEWFIDPVKEHYLLLSWVSRCLDGAKIYDIGTYRGLSALALSANPANTVVSYDIENFLALEDPPANIDFKIGDFFQDPDILSSPFIMFDVDPHDGEIERKTISWLAENHYSGIIFFDDIWLNGRMQAFWREIQQEKHDLTRYAHWSGTGAVFFDPK